MRGNIKFLQGRNADECHIIELLSFNLVLVSNHHKEGNATLKFIWNFTSCSRQFVKEIRVRNKQTLAWGWAEVMSITPIVQILNKGSSDLSSSISYNV